MSSLNRVTLLGRVGRDPEIKSFANGGRIANLSIATSEQWKDRQTGEKKERTDWHNISVSGDGVVGVVERYVKKGSQLYVEGSLQTRKWQDQNGNDRYTTEVKVAGFSGKIVLLGGGGGSSGGGGGQQREDWGGEDSRGRSGSSSGGGGFNGGGARSGGFGTGGGFTDDLDDDVPF